jgi:uncharacterized protein with ATP-grasp and redox domains
MMSDYRCYYCFTRAFERLLSRDGISPEAKDSFTRDMVNLYAKNWGKHNSPLFARELHSLLRNYTGNNDPYKLEKRNYNDIALGLLPDMKRLVKRSRDPFSTSLRLSIAGNIIDFAVNDNFNLHATLERVLRAPFAIDHSELLKSALDKARSVLYLGDNAGEIVFDKLFIETIGHPGLVYAVRGAPVINDATIEDAEYVGMSEVARVVSNGFDAPSTVLSESSDEFRELFREADLIISKGQGNLEGLIHLGDKRMFFLLMVKCNVMAEFLKVEKDSFVVFTPAGFDGEKNNITGE